jgi:hypothetical protein
VSERSFQIRTGIQPRIAGFGAGWHIDPPTICVVNQGSDPALRSADIEWRRAIMIELSPVAMEYLTTKWLPNALADGPRVLPPRELLDGFARNAALPMVGSFAVMTPWGGRHEMHGPGRARSPEIPVSFDRKPPPRASIGRLVPEGHQSGWRVGVGGSRGFQRSRNLHPSRGTSRCSLNFFEATPAVFPIDGTRPIRSQLYPSTGQGV